MKLRDLRAIVAAQPAANDDLDVLVWLPGSRIKLGAKAFEGPSNTRDGANGGKALLIEGNVAEGSTLC